MTRSAVPCPDFERDLPVVKRGWFEARHAAIHDAKQAGVRVVHIAKTCGVGKERVYTLLKQARPDDFHDPTYEAFMDAFMALNPPTPE